MQVTYRPIGSDWRGETTERRRITPFKAPWSNTLRVLDMELRQLGATGCVFQLDMAERDIRLDGMPRSDAKPSSPRVILSFESRHGWLRYQCDRFEGYWQMPGWQGNVRAIALGLEALRQVERYGITTRGEQYTGWKALPESTLSATDARRWLFEQAGVNGREMTFKEIYRMLAKRMHPDAGGSAADWAALQAAAKAVGVG